MSSTPLRGAAIALGLTLVTATLGLHATPGFWQAATQADFLRGEVENLSIDEHGRLMLGPRVERVHSAAAPFIWTALRLADGSHLLGTGNEGQVLRVSPGGDGSVFFDSGELEVHALAQAPDGTIYAGTSPEGRIYKLSARGEATPFFDPEDKYIWALAVDPKGVVYAATGDKGVVYRITPDGAGTPFFTTKTTHATALTFRPNGELLVGTGSAGRVFRVDASGKGFLLLDTSYQEVRALRLAPSGVLYVAAQSGRPPQGGDAPDPPGVEPARPAPVPTVSTEITAISIVDVPVSQSASSTPSRESGRGPAGAVYRVNPDGLWDKLWESTEHAPYDVAVEPGGALLVATGSKGVVFRLQGDPMRPTLLTRAPAQQVTMLLPAKDRTLLVTSNPGLLLALSTDRAARGTYESEVKDAGMVATWGTLSWRASVPAGAAVQLFTRAGNTRTPDEAWSEWAGPYATADGTNITSPNARYLQWRAVLTAGQETPVLTSVMAAYLQRNVRPTVASITVHPPGLVFQKPFSTGETEIAGFDEVPADQRSLGPANNAGGPALGRRVYQKGLQTFAWKADDDNGDELVYEVLYRREAETAWRRLKGPLTDSILVWDTSSVPNGTYVIKIVASDERSNPPTLALKGELESTSFDIDNTPPTVTMGEARREGAGFVLSFEVRDADSPLTRLEYSVDAQRWQSLFPADGILDARQERFELRLPADAAGRTVVIRATDALNNVGTGQTELR